MLGVCKTRHVKFLHHHCWEVFVFILFDLFELLVDFGVLLYGQFGERAAVDQIHHQVEHGDDVVSTAGSHEIHLVQTREEQVSLEHVSL